MQLKHFVLPLLITAVPAAWAAEPAPGMSPLEKALSECVAKVKKDSEGMPDRKAMDECMKAKGNNGNGTTPASGKPAKK